MIFWGEHDDWDENNDADDDGHCGNVDRVCL